MCVCVCVCVCVRAARVRRGCLLRASYPPPRNTCTGAQIRQMSPGFGARVDAPAPKQSAARNPAAAAAMRHTPDLSVVEWRATQPFASFLLFPPPLHPGLKLQPKPLPFSIIHSSVNQIDHFSLSLLGSPLSSTMGLHI